MRQQKILVTGAAGFIGFHVSKKLVDQGATVIGLDNLNDYYSVDLKYGRLQELGINKSDVTEGVLAANSAGSDFQFYMCDLENKPKVNALFEQHNFEAVIHLAAQPGVHYSLKEPQTYIDSNITGFLNILEAIRHHPVNHLVFASSSSVYGANTKVPFSTSHNVDHPMSLYAATKKSNELMAHTYANLFDIPTTGLRFFTVYGPWGRPDMAFFLFTKAMLNEEPIKVFNHGNMQRDFTYVDDIAESVMRLVDKPPAAGNNWSGQNPDPATSFAPYQLFNIGKSEPVGLMALINEIEDQLNVTARKKMMDIQPGDVPKTWADVEDLFNYIAFRPQVELKEGIARFIDWYKDYYNVEL